MSTISAIASVAAGRTVARAFAAVRAAAARATVLSLAAAGFSVRAVLAGLAVFGALAVLTVEVGVGPTAALHDVRPKVDDAIEVRGTVRQDSRARSGIEIDIVGATVLNRATALLPFTASSDVSEVGLDILTEYRPLALRNDRVGDVFRIQAAILKHFRDYLTSRGVTADRLRTVTYGEERPKHDNAREETRRLNRRAQLVVRLQQ